jgi:SAM-dependent methyltransferase
VCTEALEHVRDYDAVIQEIFRVVKPGGYVILSFQNHFNFSALLKFLLEKIYKKNWDAWGTHGHEEGYENYLTCFQVKRSAKKAGLVSVDEFGADYINAWLSWLPFFYRNYKILDRYPLLPLGKIPFLKYLGMDYFMLLKKHE